MSAACTAASVSGEPPRRRSTRRPIGRRCDLCRYRRRSGRRRGRWRSCPPIAAPPDVISVAGLGGLRSSCRPPAGSPCRAAVRWSPRPARGQCSARNAGSPRAGGAGLPWIPPAANRPRRANRGRATWTSGAWPAEAPRRHRTIGRRIGGRRRLPTAGRSIVGRTLAGGCGVGGAAGSIGSAGSDGRRSQRSARRI